MTEDPIDPTGDSLEDRTALISDLGHLADLKLRKAEIEKAIEDWQASLVKEMDADKLSELEFTDSAGRPVRATVVRSTTRTIDLAALAEMDELLANAVSKRVVDKERWDKAERMGLLSQPKFANLVQVRPKKPYILFGSPEKETTDEQ